MKKSKFSLIIPNWNGEHLLRQNLPQVLAAAEAAEIIIIDDASTDKSVAFIRKTYPQIKLVIHKRNKGFVVACNHGVSLAKGEIVVLLNTDVVPQKGFLRPILEDFSDKEIFAVSCGETVTGPGWAIFQKGDVSLVRKKRLVKKTFAFWASGGQAAFSRKKWLKLRGFDRLYRPFYWEDVDLSYRAWKRGYKVVWDPRAKVCHQHQGVIGAHFSKKYVSFIAERNKLLFIWKNITSPKMMFEHKLWLAKRLLTRPGYWKPFSAALAKKPSLFSRRLKERQEQKISDEEIFAQFG